MVGPYGDQFCNAVLSSFVLTRRRYMESEIAIGYVISPSVAAISTPEDVRMQPFD